MIDTFCSKSMCKINPINQSVGVIMLRVLDRNNDAIDTTRIPLVGMDQNLNYMHSNSLY